MNGIKKIIVIRVPHPTESRKQLPLYLGLFLRNLNCPFGFLPTARRPGISVCGL